MYFICWAQVGRKTFYHHYADKEALLYTILDDILVEGQAVLLPPTSPKAVGENTVNALLYAHHYADVFRV